MTTVPRPELRFSEARGWCTWSASDVTVWWNGHAFLDGALIEGRNAAAAIGGRAATLMSDQLMLDRLLMSLDGHFAFAMIAGDRALLACDRVRSIPILIRTNGAGHLLAIADNINALRRASDAADADSSLAMAMSGYTFDGRTLYRDIRILVAGEVVTATAGQSARDHLWHEYRPWLIDRDVRPEEWPARLTAVNEALFTKLVRSLNGRPVLLPLSGGFDSRLVASGLHRAGHRDVICYSYGRTGNSEAAAADAVAAKLGYPWHYVAYNHDTSRTALLGEAFDAYLQGGDTGAAIPFFQDFAAIQDMKRRGLVPDDAVFINGNSGDFISGNHVPLSVYDDMGSHASAEERRRTLVSQLLTKHFSLWRDLLTPENKDRISRLLTEWLERRVPADLPPDMMYAAWEALESNARQSNFVINGQRVYEYFGHLWRLPLWDNDYLSFWESVPPRQKRAQVLYRETLLKENWGGVWSDIPLNPAQRWHLPAWAALLRAGLKLASLPLGKQRWKQIDRHVFYYWIDLLATFAPVPYRDVLFDRRGFRHALSFRCRDYLARHGRGPDGQPL